MCLYAHCRLIFLISEIVKTTSIDFRAISLPEHLSNERGGCRPADGLAQRYSHPQHHQLPETVRDSHEDAGHGEEADPEAHDDGSVESIQSDSIDEGGGGEGVDEGRTHQDLEVCALPVIFPLTALIVAAGSAGRLRGEAGAVQTRVLSLPRLSDPAHLVPVVNGVRHILAGGGDQKVSDLPNDIASCYYCQEGRVLKTPV